MEHPITFWVNAGAAMINFSLCYIVWKKKRWLPIHWINVFCVVISTTLAITTGIF